MSAETAQQLKPRSPSRRLSAREVALRILHQVETKDAFVNPLLHDRLARADLSPADRGLVTALVDGTTRWRRRLDHGLAQFCRYALDRLPPWIRCLLRMGAYQLMFLDRMPARAVCDESVTLARRFGHRGTAALTNAVLRALSRGLHDIRWPDARDDPVHHIGIYYSHPDWLVRRWVDRFGFEETIALCRANNAPSPLALRANLRWMDREPLARQLAEAGTSTRPCRLAPMGLVVEGPLDWEHSSLYKQGLFTVQGEASMLVAVALAPAPEWRVADLCAGIGGKTTHLAELMGDRGQILACDYYSWKIDALKRHCRRLELSNVETRVCDARSLPPTGDFDACLLDAPCSGTGVLARRPDSRWRRTASQLGILVGLQRELLEAGWGLLRPGGVLLYSTCSIEPEENGELIATFLRDHPEASPEDLRPVLPSVPADAFTEDGAVMLLPHRHGTDGMFIARLRRQASA